MKRQIIFSIILAAAGWAFGAVPDFYDSFDSNYASGQTFPTDTTTNGWEAAGVAYVTNSGSVYSNQSVVVTPRSSLTNTLSPGGDSNSRVWSDFRIKPVIGWEAPNQSTNTSSFHCYFDTNGFMVLSVTGRWQVCTNDIWGNAVPPATNNTYVHISLYQDFGRARQAVFLNEQLLAQDLPFASSVSSYQQLVFQNPNLLDDKDSWIDNVWVKTNTGPDNVTSNFNGDGMADITEVATYGYARRTLYVSSSPTNLVPYYASITNAVAVWRPRDIIHVIAGNYSNETVTLASNPSNVVFEGDAFVVSNLTVASNASASFAQTLSCGTLTVSGQVAMASGMSLTSTTAHVVGSLSLSGNGAFVVSALDFGPAGVVNFTSAQLVASAAGVTMNGTFAITGTTLGSSFGDLLLSGNVAVAGQNFTVNNLTVVSGATVSFAQAVNCSGTLWLTGQVAMAQSASLTSSIANVVGTMTLASNAVFVTTGTLNVTGAGLLSFTNAQLMATTAGVNMNGTFAISNTWGSALVSMPLPFNDTFELYASGSVMTNLKFRGWNASTETVIVTNGISQTGTKSVAVPTGTVLSNSIASSATKVWSDFYLRPVLGVQPAAPQTNDSSFLAYADTNGFLVVATNGGGWYVCSNVLDKVNTTPTLLQSNSFTRITLCQDLGTHTFAVFIAGDLVAQMLSFPANLNTYSSLVADNQSSTAFLDDVLIVTSVPPGLPPTASEINTYGQTIASMPHGTVFKIR